MEIGPNDKVIAHTRVSIPQGNGPIEAESIIEAIPHNIEKENHLSPKRSSRRSNGNNNNPLNEYVDNTPKKSENNSYAKFGGATREHVFGQNTFLKYQICFCCQKKFVFFIYFNY